MEHLIQRNKGNIETFYVLPEFAIAGYPQVTGDAQNRQLLEKGFNVVSAEFFYRGTATSAKGLIDDAGVVRAAENFIPTDSNGATTGSLKIKNSAGLSVGVGETEYSILKISSELLENADAVVRKMHTKLVVEDIDKVVVHTTRIVTVFPFAIL